MSTRRLCNLMIAAALVAFSVWTVVVYDQARREFSSLYTKETVAPAIPMAHFKLQANLQSRLADKMQPIWLVMGPLLVALILLRVYLPRHLDGRRPHAARIDNEIYHPRPPAPIHRRSIGDPAAEPLASAGTAEIDLLHDRSFDDQRLHRHSRPHWPAAPRSASPGPGSGQHPHRGHGPVDRLHADRR